MHPVRTHPPLSSPRKREVTLELVGAALGAVLRVPQESRGIVLFAHGSGSGRLSPRNNYVAERFAFYGIASLLADLLTAQEEEIDAVTAQLRFDIALLTDRLLAVTAWVERHAQLHALPIGYFGASTGAAAALAAAARLPHITAVVSRGGRPDLAAATLEQVHAPTLLIVGGHDPEVLNLNRSALARLRCEAQLEVVPGATHLFAGPGALEQVATLAARWFERHFDAEAARRTASPESGP